MRLHAAYAVPHYAYAPWRHQRRFKHAAFFCFSAALAITHPAQKHDRNHVCMNIISIFTATNGGGFSFIWPSEHKKKGYSPPHRLVGELAHPIELLLHFVFTVFKRLLGSHIPHYFS